jgi:gamma-glutamyltranspeptidase/glutathione hydrolase
MTHQFPQAAVAAPHHAAVEAGRAVLAEGGNAIEAALAAAAAIAVVYPHMNGIGGDNFWCIRETSGRVRAIAAAGPAGSRATIAAYRAAGHDAVPSRGALAALTVPGAIAGWQAAAAIARENGGRLPIDMLLHHAVHAARDGHAVGASEARYVLRDDSDLLALPHFKETFFIEGKQPNAGTRRSLPRLADTLEHLARAGLEDFYRGDIARELASDLAAVSAPVTRDDLARFTAKERQPLVARVRDAVIHMPPPPSQGLASLLMLGILEATGVPAREGAEHAHAFIEAVKRANTLRDTIVTDFDRMPFDPMTLLTPAVFRREAELIDHRRAGPFPAPMAPDGGTIWLGAVDGRGMAVSLIQSLFWDYGSGVTSPATGVLMQNRGMAFSLDPTHLNALAPGRTPFHTLHAPLAVFDDGRVLSYGAMGGEVQPQITALLYARHVLGAMEMTAALAAPRFTFGRRGPSPRPHVRAEAALDPAIIDGLIRRGHEVDVVPDSVTDTFGHAGMLLRAPRGGIVAAHDPRADGGAAGV